MNEIPSGAQMPTAAIDSGLVALSAVAGYYRIVADPLRLARELVLGDRSASHGDVLRAANRIGLKARIVTVRTGARLRAIPAPAIVKLKAGGYVLYGGLTPTGEIRLVDPVSRIAREVPIAAALGEIEIEAVLVQRRFRGDGVDPKTFGFSWFLPSIWRYRKPLANVLLASLFVQLFALVTPLFFQAIVDKVVVHKGYSTLAVLVGGLAVLGIFDVSLQYLRSYALSHTTNRIDVELGRRLFAHLLRLPLGYFETRSAGQTVARVRELETIRSFLTGQALFSAIDLFFALIFIAVLLAYSWRLTLIVVASIPLYILITVLIRPALRDKIKEKFNRGAESQQFLVESIVGVQTLKAAAVEPAMQAQWEEKLAAYVKTSFEASMFSAGGQNAIQYVNKLVTAGILYFGATAVMDGSLTVGGLIAFNMISSQVMQPVLRLSQLWQDFQQVQVSVERLGDILNTATERAPSASIGSLPPPKGAIEFRNVRFRYRPGAPEVLKSVSLSIRPGEVIGIVGPSGSGKSTLTKLVQRLYLPEEGQILVDRADIAQIDPAWLRGNIGVVLQENLLFNRSIHDNIALANPTTSRAVVMQVARLAGADEFIDKLPNGYDTIIEERGANLSGGQRQRLAIARALATNPPILIFDEATSALDYESERVIHRNMKSIVQGRTVIIIAHRLAAVRPCNRIISMAEGRIVEIGSHEELVRRPGGLYAHLWALQTDQLQEERV
ncbi:type I secretion system permease/ATPase [Rhizobium sp. CNPSo 4039]|uniref:peptidase domain-containing ABC transporter n=1 Tax=Rhizobium sp. CNPSo 4039 TaxID=3021409 RepID=UPI00254D6FB4|nr:type I secretion system permease/ATPase [Rhizobium sp. CNPSo 4039]MDK4715914.1 type I secretion system permease/ATPase [Rhizobium sp. CNPSo 4039]